MRSSAGVATLALMAGLMALIGLGACSAPKSFVVVTMRSAEATPIRDVKEVEVTVKQAPSFSVTLTYPPPSGMASITIDQNTKTDLSVDFTGARSGTVTMSIDVRNTAGCVVGHGSTTAVIKRGGVATTGVDLFPTFNCTDGGAPGNDGGGVIFNGCDPVSPVCGGGKTCQVNCDTHMGECISGGTGGHGSVCMKNNNCAPGTQCFDYAGAGCNVKLCLRFCNDDKQCQVATQPADGGADAGGAEVGGGAAVGTRSVCAGPVACGQVTTGYHTCTFGCDPRATAVAASGCPAGLACLIVGSMDQVDCACPETTRKGTDGATCVSSTDCAPGFICNMMSGAQRCRAVCRCDADGMKCNAPNDCADGKTCSALTNDTTFGVCL
jgi:hypothetical protein